MKFVVPLLGQAETIIGAGKTVGTAPSSLHSLDVTHNINEHGKASTPYTVDPNCNTREANRLQLMLLDACIPGYPCGGPCPPALACQR